MAVQKKFGNYLKALRTLYRIYVPFIYRERLRIKKEEGTEIKKKTKRKRESLKS